MIHRQYTGFNSRGELEWEVGPDGYYSEFKYDDAGRIISAAFPGDSDGKYADKEESSVLWNPQLCCG